MADLKGICVPVCTPFDKSGDAGRRRRAAPPMSTRLLDARRAHHPVRRRHRRIRLPDRGGAAAHPRAGRQAGRRARALHRAGVGHQHARHRREQPRSRKTWAPTPSCCCRPISRGRPGRRDVALRACRQGRQDADRRLQHPAEYQPRHHAGALRAAAGRSTTSSTSRTAPAISPASSSWWRPAARSSTAAITLAFQALVAGCDRRHLGRRQRHAARGGAALRAGARPASWPRPPRSGSACCRRRSSSGPTTTIRR